MFGMTTSVKTMSIGPSFNSQTPSASKSIYGAENTVATGFEDVGHKRSDRFLIFNQQDRFIASSGFGADIALFGGQWAAGKSGDRPSEWCLDSADWIW